MYCPSCSTHSIDGAKFCKSCGMNLSVITQALNGGVVISDPIRDREFKRARKQISDGIHGSAIGAALLVAAALPYSLIPATPWIYPASLVLALGGIIKLFRSIGSIIDAKVGPKLLDPALQPRATGGLNSSQPFPTGVRPSQRLSTGQQAHTRAIGLEGEAGSTAAPSEAPVENFARPSTGRINREHSSPLRAFDKDDDLMSKLRN
ncbi:MAG: zinc ribbon domain-containing protein [Acidobacteriota bacterium]